MPINAIPNALAPDSQNPTINRSTSTSPDFKFVDNLGRQTIYALALMLGDGAVRNANEFGVARFPGT
jgi:hypothetical protein